MRQSIVLVFCLCIVSRCFSAPADSANAPANDKPSTAPLTEPAKSSEDKPSTGTRTAGSPEEVDKLRTHSPQALLLEQLRGITASLQHSPNILTPTIGAPVIPSYSVPSYGSYGSYGGYGGYGAGYSSKFIPSFGFGSSYVQPAISRPVPVVAPAPVAVQTAHVPVVSQTAVSKPVVTYNEHVVQQPVYSVSQQVIHKPIYTEVLEVIRRPVITEIEEVIHKPVVTELQQIIKKPLYTQHVVKTPSYGSVKQEVYQAPLHVPGESVHVVDKPVSQFLQLPTQVVQPVAAHVVQTPVVHQQLSTQTVVASKPVTTGIIGSYPSYGYGSYGSGSGLSSGYGFGSGYGIGSGYGSGFGSGYGSGYGSGLGSGYGYGSSYGSYPYAFSGYGAGLSGISSHGESAYQYLIPSYSCRATGTCSRDAEAAEQKSFVTGANGAVAAPLPYNMYYPYGTGSGSQLPLNNIFSGPTSYIGQPEISPLSDQPIVSKQSQPAATGKSSEQSEKLSPDEIAEAIRTNKQFYSDFNLIVDKIKASKRTAKPESFDVEESLKMINGAAKNNPAEWNKIFNSEIKPKIESIDRPTPAVADPLKKQN